ncbi:ParA family chromosome partitioning protein [Desulfuromonas soudanensis]|uniref:ParA family chromosome partitioning protein n=1 Tax=Desulfuromonas soudanensis TaxID=1603606 RepID=A0A0M4D7L6_9BACT|nr:ParA family protein [Desulfuromonas soudanensis]ALC17160.1 ParA family chromosome partitioning protein [Desulfuromonas soudanensis]
MAHPYVVTISSEKGGVGKTTLATNLAIYLKALNEELPVTLLSFDNHFTVDRMFRIGRTQGRGDVADLMNGRAAEEIIEIGQYGVQFIPSSKNLHQIRDRIKNSDVLARVLAASALEGIVIIDTRPDLDVYTQNALFAADRVIVPVKDAPSLENCRNLYDFFDSQQLSRRPLRILPCLVDTRIRFDGPFKDTYQLLKGYAINRGYRCMEGFVAKSPKVESLSTNPEGKIYPVLTHGRGTDVHVQFTHLARQIYLEVIKEPERRLGQVQREEEQAVTCRSDAFVARRLRLESDCPLCGKQLVEAQGIINAGYYWETSDQALCGYLDDECFSEAVFRHFYRSKREIGTTDPLRELFRESAQRSYFVLRRGASTVNFHRQQLAFYRFDEEGLEVSCKIIDLKDLESSPGVAKQGLTALLARTLIEGDGLLGDRFLLIRRVGSDLPEEILYDDLHQPFLGAAVRIASQLP